MTLVLLVAGAFVFGLLVAGCAGFLVGNHLRCLVSGIETRAGFATWIPATLKNLPPVNQLHCAVHGIRQRLRESEERYRIVTDNVAAAVILHGADGKVFWCSPYTEVLSGYSRSEIISQPNLLFQTIIHEDDRETFERALKIIATGEAFQCRYRFYHKSGLLMWAETRTVPIFDEDTKSYLALSVTLDITGSVLYQQRIEETNRDLHEFTYMISHDLKSPIFTMEGMLSILEEELTETASPQIKEAMVHAKRAAARLKALANGVVELARSTSEPAKPKPVSIKELVSDVTRDMAVEISHSKATVIVEDDLPNVHGDPTRLYQVFSNLLSNALKYRSPDRPLEIHIENGPQKSSRKALIVVRDNGIGIPEAKLDSVFQPFQRIHPEMADGSGVGLACVRRAVEKLGGNVKVSSEVDEGSAFQIELRKA